MAFWDVFKRKDNKIEVQQVNPTTQQKLQNSYALQGQMAEALSRTFTTSHVYPHYSLQLALKWQSNPGVKSVLERAGKKFGSIPRYIYNHSDNTISGTAKDLEKLINRPNKKQGADRFFDAVYRQFKLTGEVFIYLNKGLSNEERRKKTDDEILEMPTLSMEIFPSHLVRLCPSKESLFDVEGYELNVDGNWRWFSYNEILHWFTPTICDITSGRDAHLRGTSPLIAGVKTVEMYEAALDFMNNSLKDAGGRGFISTDTEQVVSPEQEALVQTLLDNKFNNVQHAGNLVWLPFKASFQSVGLAPVDSLVIEGKEAALKEICMLFGYPYELINTENVNWANGPSSQRYYLNSSVMPDVKQLDDELNRMLLPGFKVQGKVYIHSDSTELEENKRDLAAIGNFNIQSPQLTMNEKRAAAGYEPIDNPLFDEPWITAGMTPLSQLQDADLEAIINQVRNPPTPPTNGEAV